MFDEDLLRDVLKQPLRGVVHVWVAGYGMRVHVCVCARAQARECEDMDGCSSEGIGDHPTDR